MPKINVGIGGVQIPADGKSRSLVGLALPGTCSWRGIKPKEPCRHRGSQPRKGDTTYFLQRNQKKPEVLCKDKEQLLK